MDEGNSGSVLGTGSSEAPAPEVVSDWRSGLPEDVAGDPSLADIKDVSSLAKSYVHAQRMVGRDKVSIPQDGASEDEWNSFYDRLGRPEKYQISKEAVSFPENFPVDENIQNLEEGLLSLYHSAGLTNDQANKVHTGLLKQLVDDFEEAQSVTETRSLEWKKQLEKDFGKAYDQQVDFAQRAARQFGGDEVINFLEESGLGDNPLLVKMFAKIGSQMSESTVTDGAGASNFALTPNAARQEIARLQRDPVFMKQYAATDTDGHKEAVEKMQNLFDYAYPDEEAA